jgi:hypothetical protein
MRIPTDFRSDRQDELFDCEIITRDVCDVHSALVIISPNWLVSWREELKGHFPAPSLTPPKAVDRPDGRDRPPFSWLRNAQA